MTITRAPGSEITSPLAEDLMLLLMELRRNMASAFDATFDTPKQAEMMSKAMKNLENLEELIRPDIFSSEMLELS